jgi:hypothetical protein
VPGPAPAPYPRIPVGRPTDGYATGSLICAIAAIPGLLCCAVPGLVLGIVAFFLGNTAVDRIRAGQGAVGGETAANVGRILGLIVAALGALGLVAFGLFLLSSASSGA